VLIEPTPLHEPKNETTRRFSRKTVCHVTFYPSFFPSDGRADGDGDTRFVFENSYTDGVVRRSTGRRLNPARPYKINRSFGRHGRRAFVKRHRRATIAVVFSKRTYYLYATARVGKREIASLSTFFIPSLIFSKTIHPPLMIVYKGYRSLYFFCFFFFYDDFLIGFTRMFIYLFLIRNKYFLCHFL